MGILFISPFFVIAYSDDTTHPALTSETVIFFNIHYPDLSFTEEEKKLLTQGSTDEDKGTRALQHFYDPVYDRGITMFGIEWQKSKEWAQDTLAQATYNFNILSNPTEKVFYGTVREFFRSDTDYSWERAIYEYAWGDKERGLKSLGHVLHLIQDASVPDHTRNDPHPPAFHLGSPYEKWTAQFGPENINVLDKLTFKKPVEHDRLEKYFNEIAKYSNNNFFSKDTIFDENYAKPKVSYEWQETLDDGRWYKFGYRDIDGKQYRLVVLPDIPDWKAVLDQSESLTIVDPDHLILTDYWNLLSQQAVLHGAGVVKLFFDEVEKEQETKTLYRKNRNWLQRLFDGTKKDIYNTTTAIYGGSVPYEELEDDSFNAQSASVVAVQIANNQEQQTELQVRPVDETETQQDVENVAIETDDSTAVNDEDVLDDLTVLPTDTVLSQMLVVSEEIIVKDDSSKPTPYQPGFGGGSRGNVETPSEESEPPAEEEEVENTSEEEEEDEEEGEEEVDGDDETPLPFAVPIPIILSPSEDILHTAFTSTTFFGFASSTLTISNDFSSATTTPDENEEWTLTLSGFEEGTTTVAFFTTNIGGATSSSATKTIVVDTTAPVFDSFTILQCEYSLSTATCLSGGVTLNLSWSSASTDVAYYALTLDSIQTSTTTDISGTLTVPSDGSYSIQVAAYDTVGNGATTSIQSVAVIARPLVINEIAWGGTGASSADEWVEIFNRTSYAIDMTKVSLVADDGVPDLLLSSTALPQGYYLIERTDDTTTSVNADLAVAFSGSGVGSGLSNDGEVLRLIHTLGGQATTTLDGTPALSSCGGTWCVGAAGPNYISMERANPALEGTLASSWKSNNTFTKNGTDADGTVINGTPRAQNSVSLPSIGYYCLPASESFVEDGFYAPPESALCTYLSSALSPATPRYGDVYRGIVASSTLKSGHSLGRSENKTETDSYVGATQGDNYFVAIYEVRTGPAFNDLPAFRAFFKTGTNQPPHLNYGVINWRYGTAP